MRHHKLGMKALAGLFILAVVVILSTCLTIDIRYKKEQMNTYNDIAFSYARTAAEYIDGDRIRSYEEDNTEDDYYRQVQRFLAISQAQTDLEYYSVFIPYEEDLVYIWDVGSGEGVRPLGYREPYMEGGREVIEQVCANTYTETRRGAQVLRALKTCREDAVFRPNPGQTLGRLITQLF